MSQRVVKTFRETSAASVVVQGRKRTNSGILQKTASNSQSGAANVTLSAHFFVTFLSQSSASNVEAWSSLYPLQTANCSRVVRNRFCRMERFLQTVFEFAITRRCVTFFNDEAHFKLNRCVNKQNIHYWSANNPNWQIKAPAHLRGLLCGHGLMCSWCSL